jgi:hypothetical protein
LRARGGITVDETWKDGALVEAVLHADRDGDIPVRYGAEVRTLRAKAGVALRFRPADKPAD